MSLRIAALAALALLGALCGAATAQPYPTKGPIRFVLGFPPGPLDIVARPVAQKLEAALGQTIVIENRPGANGAIASEQVARTEPDGYTLLLGTSGTHVTAVHLVKNLPYDPVKDFTPIIATVEPVTCVAVNPSLPVKNVSELIAYAKANPGKLSYGSPGVGSVFHLLGELFNQIAGVQIQHVPYRGLEQAMTDVIANHIPMLFTSCSTVAPHAAAGKARILAVLEPERFSRLADVPSISESLPAFKKPSTWFGIFGPKGLPEPVVTRLNKEFNTVLQLPDIKARFEDNAYTVIGGSPDKLRDLLADGIDRFGQIIKSAGIKAE
jgi:tripartite-type tricarboxylate transporter receptor subunit TctC